MKATLAQMRKKEKTTSLTARIMRNMNALCQVKTPSQPAMKKMSTGLKSSCTIQPNKICKNYKKRSIKGDFGGCTEEIKDWGAGRWDALSQNAEVEA